MGHHILKLGGSVECMASCESMDINFGQEGLTESKRSLNHILTIKSFIKNLGLARSSNVIER